MLQGRCEILFILEWLLTFTICRRLVSLDEPPILSYSFHRFKVIFLPQGKGLEGSFNTIRMDQGSASRFSVPLLPRREAVPPGLFIGRPLMRWTRHSRFEPALPTNRRRRQSTLTEPWASSQPFGGRP